MKRSLAVGIAFALVTVLAVVSPASANHNTPITITVQSTYAGLCGANPGPDLPLPPGWTTALQANAALTPDARVPTDLWKGGGGQLLGNVSGSCSYGTDAFWNAGVAARGTADCNLTIKTGCRGLHYPGVGPPVQPGRFLNYSNGFGAPDPKNACAFVSTGTPNQGSCTIVATGYVLPVSPQGSSIEGGYCGTSRGFGWALAAADPAMTGATKTFSVLEWIPSSAGSLLPISGIVTGPNWSKNAHFLGWTGTPGQIDLQMNGQKNVFSLVTARSYISMVDTEPGDPGSCGMDLNKGGVKFFNQGVAIGLGD